jgi:hypothetical protein
MCKKKGDCLKLLKGLKKLGLLKTSKKRRKNKNTSNNINTIKSSSDHLLGPPTMFSSNMFQNTNNLINENLRLRNEELENNIKNPILRIKDDEDKIRINKRLQDYDNNIELTDYLLRTMHNASFNKSLNKSTGLDNRVEDLGTVESDNIDVPETGGSDTFTNGGNDEEETPTPDEGNNTWQETAEEKEDEEKEDEEEEEDETALTPQQIKNKKAYINRLKNEYKEYGGKSKVILQSQDKEEIKDELKRLKLLHYDAVKKYGQKGGTIPIADLPKNIKAIKELTSLL